MKWVVKFQWAEKCSSDPFQNGIGFKSQELHFDSIWAMPWNVSWLAWCWNAQTWEIEGRAPVSSALSQIFPKTGVHCGWSWRNTGTCQATIPSGECSDICDPSSLNRVLELIEWFFSAICDIWWFWIYIWKTKAFPSAQVYPGVEIIADKWEQAY